MRTAYQEGSALISVFVGQEFVESSNVDLTFVRLNLAAYLQSLVHNYQQRQHIRRGSAARGNWGRPHRYPTGKQNVRRRHPALPPHIFQDTGEGLECPASQAMASTESLRCTTDSTSNQCWSSSYFRVSVPR